MFFTLSILWQQGLGRSALETGLLVLPFSVASLLTASNSYRFSTRFGRKTVQAGIAAVFAGLALVLLVLHLMAPRPDIWELIGPLFLAGLGSGLVIAPNQDFVLSSVPRAQAGTAGGALTTAQRIGAAIGIAVIGTALFGSGGGHGGNVALTRSLTHTAQTAVVLNLRSSWRRGCARSASQAPGRTTCSLASLRVRGWGVGVLVSVLAGVDDAGERGEGLVGDLERDGGSVAEQGP